MRQCGRVMLTLPRDGGARLYLDANATEPLRPAARAAVMSALDCLGNPSSIHAEGRAARRILETAREHIAVFCRARPEDVVFCSGATEANALAIASLGHGKRILIGATEHDAIRMAAPDALLLTVHNDGTVDLAAVQRALKDNTGALVCLMAANNETGVLHPIKEVAKLCEQFGALLHVDAVQAAGRLRADFCALGASSVALSSHKLGGPKGAGALVLARDVSDRVMPLIAGGGQERGRRGGTPDLPAISGFAAAAAAIASEERMRVTALRDAIEAEALSIGATVVGKEAPRLWNTSCLALPGIKADAQVIGLDLAGIAVSAGAACSSGKVRRSHVLTAMGLKPLAEYAIRVSLPWNAPADAATKFCAAYRKIAIRALHSSDASHIAMTVPAG